MLLHTYAQSHTRMHHYLCSLPSHRQTRRSTCSSRHGLKDGNKLRKANGDRSIISRARRNKVSPALVAGSLRNSCGPMGQFDGNRTDCQLIHRLPLGVTCLGHRDVDSLVSTWQNAWLGYSRRLVQVLSWLFFLSFFLLLS